MIRLVGVIHLPALPGSPRWSGDDGAWESLLARVAAEARLLQMSKYDLVMVENFGDAPFFASEVPPITVSAMTACALAAKNAAPGLPLGINVLRNDARSALSIASVVGATCIRVNVHVGARVTDQGIIEGRAAHTLRLRRELGSNVQIWADVDVKHSSPLAAVTAASLDQEVKDAAARGLADAVLVTGEGTGASASDEKLGRVKKAVSGLNVPLYSASGSTPESLESLGRYVDGVIVGSALRENGLAGAPLEAGRVERFATAFRATRGFGSA